MKRFFNGFRFVFDGLSLIRNGKGLLKWAVMPFVTVFVLFWIALIGAFYWGPSILQWALARFGVEAIENQSLWAVVLYVVFFLAFVVSFAYISYLFISLISAPFHSVLAEKSLRQLGETNLTGFRFVFLLGAIFKVAVLAFAGVGFLLGSVFIPGVNLLSAFFLFFIISYDSADYSLELLGYSYKRRWRFVKTHFVEFCGMATFVGLTLLIPGLILLLMPAAVTGSAILVFRLHHSVREVA